MKRLAGALMLLLFVVGSSTGHFVFILPGEARVAQVVFSDELKPDGDLVKKVAHTRFTVKTPDGKVTEVKASRTRQTLDIKVPGKGPALVTGITAYGVLEKGKVPFLLTYYSKAAVGLGPGSKLPEFLAKPDAKLDLDIVTVHKGKPAVRVLWKGKPVAGAEVVLYVPGKDESVQTKTDRDGLVVLAAPGRDGTYGIRARYVVPGKGKHNGKEYAEARSYATFTFPVQMGSPRGDAVSGKVEADPQATKLLADARAARANWEDFPGFTADVAVNVEGKVHKGKVEVSSKGKVKLEVQGDAKEWARRLLASVVGHRMDDTTTLTTPCAFADTVADHPLGRAIRVLNDEFHSSYRIRDRQVIVVNRQMGAARFTITVIENRQNAQKKYLPATYVVNTWDSKTEVLKSSVTHHNTWVRVGKLDLPATLTVVSAEAGKQVTRTIALSEHRLNKN
jgi:hypothetical protein